MYAIRALTARGLPDPLHTRIDALTEDLNSLGKGCPLFILGCCLLGELDPVNLNSMEAVAELPKVELMMKGRSSWMKDFTTAGPTCSWDMVRVAARIG